MKLPVIEKRGDHEERQQHTTGDQRAVAKSICLRRIE
jgi:hypothetical protein